MIPSSFPDAWLVVANTVAAVALVTGTAGAQSLPAAARISVESVYDVVTQGGDGPAGNGGAARVRAEAAHQRSSRRASLKFWGAVTADQGWAAPAARTLATGFTVDSTIVMSRRTRISLSERVSSAPLDLFMAFGATDPANVSRSVTSGSELSGVRTTSQNANVTMTRTTGPRSDVALSVTQFSSRTGRDAAASGAVAGKLTRRLGQFTGWHTGYGLTVDAFRHGEVRSGDRRHDIDVGVDYSRPLPFWSNTTFAIASGSTVLAGTDRRYVRMNVTAAVEHRLARHWTGRADYSRPIQVVAGFAEPLLSDAIRVAMTGTTARRVSLSFSVGAARGTLGAGGDRFESLCGVIRASRRIGTHLVVEGEYHDARYVFGAGLSHAGRIPADFSRRGVRAGLVWAPAARVEGSDGVTGS